MALPTMVGKQKMLKNQKICIQNTVLQSSYIIPHPSTITR